MVNDENKKLADEFRYQMIKFFVMGHDISDDPTLQKILKDSIRRFENYNYDDLIKYAQLQAISSIKRDVVHLVKKLNRRFEHG